MNWGTWRGRLGKESFYKVKLRCLWKAQGQTDSENWINGCEAQERDLGNISMYWVELKKLLFL